MGGALIGSEPKSAATAAQVTAFYSAHHTKILVSAYFNALAVVVGLLFYSTLRDFLARSPACRHLAATLFGGAVLFATGGALAAGTELALADVPGRLIPAAAQALNIIENDLGPYVIYTGLAVMIFAAGLAIIRARTLPAWIGWVALPTALLAIFPPPVDTFSLPVAGVWSLVVSILMYLRYDTAGSEATTASVSDAPLHTRAGPAPA
jgi:hypothetical protein